MTSEAKTESGVENCPVVETLSLLRQKLQATEGDSSDMRSMLAHGARIVTEISLGRGEPSHLNELDRIAQKIAMVDSVLVNTLQDSLTGRKAAWLQHVTDGTCPVGQCIKPSVVPCQEACPAHIDIPSMLGYIGKAQYTDALDLLLKDTPLPNSCGLVCPAPCEDACVQNSVSAPVVIKPMKSVAARCSGGYALPDCDASTGKKVGVVGAGPAGLTVAYYLAQKGHQVEIFDENEHPGGIMRYGIPEYRLPNPVLYAEVDMIKALGVQIHQNTRIANLKDLREQGFDAIFLATGLQKSKGMRVEGDDQPFVLGGVDFLRDVRDGKNPRVGPHVVVIGGGNTAIDAAMTAFRQGAAKVEIWYRRTRKAMPANPHEVEMALDEGVELMEYWQPNRILPGNQIEFVRHSNAPDADTAQPVVIQPDQVIAAIGQDPDNDYLEGNDIQLEWGNIVADPVTLMTDVRGVFSGGDIQHGGSTVVAAIGSGKRAAESIHAYLTEGQMDLESLKPQRRTFVEPVQSDPQARVDSHRPHVPEEDPIKRRTSHDPIQFDFNEEIAKAEAARCLRCDQCIGCGLCELACIEVGANALRMVQTESGRMVFDGFLTPATMCIGCGACAAVCPTGAIKVEDDGNERVTTITGTEVRRQPLQACATCGVMYATVAQVDSLRDKLGLEDDAPAICPACLREKMGVTVQAMHW